MIFARYASVLLLAASMAACAHSPDVARHLDGAWQVEHARTANGQTVVFEGDDRAHGEGGCNRWFADVLANGAGELRFGPVGATRRACIDTGAQQHETTFLSMLTQVRSYRLVAADRVELLDTEGKVVGTLRR